MKKQRKYGFRVTRNDKDPHGCDISLLYIDLHTIDDGWWSDEASIGFKWIASKSPRDYETPETFESAWYGFDLNLDRINNEADYKEAQRIMRKLGSAVFGSPEEAINSMIAAGMVQVVHDSRTSEWETQETLQPAHLWRWIDGLRTTCTVSTLAEDEENAIEGITKAFAEQIGKRTYGVSEAISDLECWVAKGKPVSKVHWQEPVEWVDWPELIALPKKKESEVANAS